MTQNLRKSLRALLTLMTPAQKKFALLCVGITLLVSFTEILAASLIVALARGLTDPAAHQGLIVLTILAVVIFVVKGGLATFDVYMQGRCIQNLILDFKKRLLDRYTQMDYAQQIMRNSGQSLSVLYSDVDIWMLIGLTSMGIMLSEICVAATLMGFLLFMQPVVTIVLILIFAGMGFLFLRYLAPKFKQWGHEVQQSAERGFHQALQIMQSYKDILIFGKAAYFSELYQEQARRRAAVTVKAAVAQVFPRVSLEAVFMMFFAGLVLMSYAVDYDLNKLTVLLSAYLYAGFRMLPSLNRLVIHLSNVRMSEASIGRIVGELQSPYTVGVYTDEPGLVFEKGISVQNVTYRYPETSRDILKDVSVEVKKGEFVGIIGETGSGKSTLLHLMLGLLIPEQGRVLIDGKYAANAREWHRRVGYAAQNFHLVEGTIADNIAFGIPPENRDHALIEDVVRDARLTPFIERLPQGIETPIGEKGVLISGGERQRIALARALYIRPDILMLDEATSALDLETEASIMQAVDGLKGRGLTIIAVTHRMATLKSADRIIALENGQIVERERL